MRILVVSPHPDDETLGAGGTLLKYKDLGNEIYWMNVTNMKESYGYVEKSIKMRKEQIDIVKREYGFKCFYDLGLEPAGLDKYEMGILVEKFKQIFNEVQPHILFLPYYSDIHTDHQIVFNAAYSCLKRFRAPYIRKVLCMEIISETDQAMAEKTFRPNVFVNITDYLKRKIEILNIYESEVKAAPFPRNAEAIKGLASVRGG